MSDFEICKTFCAISINAGDISQLPLACTSTKAIYCEYSLINHMCKSNCDWEQENGGVSVYTFNDIEESVQLGTSYVIPDYYLGISEGKR